jgi:hypothetical protein
MSDANNLATLRTGVIAGTAGGLAEIAWVTLYAGMTGADPAALAQGVTTAAGISKLLPTDSPVALGVGVHMVLAAMLGIILVFVWQALATNRPQQANPYPLMLAALGGIWTISFFQLLCGPADCESRVYSYRALCGQPDVETAVRHRSRRSRPRRSDIDRATTRVFTP